MTAFRALEVAATEFDCAIARSYELKNSRARGTG